MSVSIGITERGDACQDLSWTKLIDYVDRAIIISKGFNSDFNNELLKYKNKIIYHATCTGLGETILEPNVPFYLDQIENIKLLINSGFPVEHIVVRIDPIIPKDIFIQLPDYARNIDEKFKENSLEKDYKYVAIVTDIIYRCLDLGIRRFRYSFLDLYSHVIKRLENKNIVISRNEINEIECSDWMMQFDSIEDDIYFKDNNIKKNKDEVYNINPQDLTVFFESCAEKHTRDYHKIGCVSKRDFEILGLNIEDVNGSSNQRPLCLCCSAKTELLKSKKPCPHSCLYCYWKN